MKRRPACCGGAISILLSESFPVRPSEHTQNLKHHGATVLVALPRTEDVLDAGVDVARAIWCEDLFRGSLTSGDDLVEEGDGSASAVVDVLAGGCVSHQEHLSSSWAW